MPVDHSVHALPDDLYSAVVRSLSAMIAREPGSITRQTRFFDDLSFDSTSVLELLMQLETDLGVEFDVETLEPKDLETVGALVDYVAKHSVAAS